MRAHEGRGCCEGIVAVRQAHGGQHVQGRGPDLFHRSAFRTGLPDHGRRAWEGIISVWANASLHSLSLCVEQQRSRNALRKASVALSRRSQLLTPSSPGFASHTCLRLAELQEGRLVHLFEFSSFKYLLFSL